MKVAPKWIPTIGTRSNTQAPRQIISSISSQEWPTTSITWTSSRVQLTSPTLESHWPTVARRLGSILWSMTRSIERKTLLCMKWPNRISTTISSCSLKKATLRSSDSGMSWTVAVMVTALCSPFTCRRRSKPRNKSNNITILWMTKSNKVSSYTQYQRCNSRHLRDELLRIFPTLS